MPLIYSGSIKAAAHISNGGLAENIASVLPNNLYAEIDANTWRLPSVIGWLAANDNRLTAEVIAKTFNCGMGFALIVAENDQNWKKIRGAVQIGNFCFI